LSGFYQTIVISVGIGFNHLRLAMTAYRFVRNLLLTSALCGFLGTPVRADEARVDVQESIRRGLDWLAKNQDKNEGCWSANGEYYAPAMTGFAGMCFLMEGSTLREGKYKENLRKAVEWFLKRAQPSGLLVDVRLPREAGHYMHGHGYALLFLASIYGEEDDERRRSQLERVLIKAVEFCGKAQTSRGGWGYVTAIDGNDFDEGSVTITQLQGLRAARNAGIKVPKSIIDKAVKYLRDCTTPRGGIIYSAVYGGQDDRPALTAAAVACSFSAGDYNSDYAKKWIKFCNDNIAIGRDRLPHDEYLNYYFAQAIYVLGDTQYQKLFPNAKKGEGLTWSKYRDAMFERIKTTQSSDGSWNSGYIGEVYTTSINLTILQLENSTLPIYQR
jgi:hypothetical protein